MVIIPTEKRFDWKHAPIMLFVIVVLNVLIYFGYQHNDDKKIYSALSRYDALGLLEYEWPAYREFLKSKNEDERLVEVQELYNHSEYPDAYFNLLYEIITDKDFFQYLQQNSYDVFDANYVTNWTSVRTEINQQIESISSISYGLIPKQMDTFSFISYQFLHGSAMHLIGNLFFLIVCGFAVEAAIGHLKFLLFYLISGVAGGLLFCFVNPNSNIPLVGASGSISGVMAMYLGVFRFKKIEFFYWFFVFVGYFRAPALLILPFYIGKELYDYFNDVGSNVAFMAHAGGFIAGALAMIVTYLINPKLFNIEYIEEDQSLPQVQKDMGVVNDFISKFKFQSAEKALDSVMKKYGENFDRLILKYNLQKLLSNNKRHELMFKIAKLQNLNESQLTKLQSLWDVHKESMIGVKKADLYNLGYLMANSTHFKVSEEIFEILNKDEEKFDLLVNLSRKLSTVFSQINNSDKTSQYKQLTQQLES